MGLETVSGITRAGKGRQTLPARVLDAAQMKTRYQDVKAKHGGMCARCRAPLQAGRTILWDSQERRAYCDACAEIITMGGLFGAPAQEAPPPKPTTPKE